MENTKQRLEQLLRSDQWSDEDQVWLNKYLKEDDLEELRGVVQEDYNNDLLSLTKVLKDRLSTQILSNIYKKLHLDEDDAPRKMLFLRKYVAAAVILIVLSAGLYLYVLQQAQHDNGIALSLLKSNDIAPGSNKAILTLASGKIINLSAAVNGNLVQEGGVTVTKTKDGQLVYTAKDPGLHGENETGHHPELISGTNTIETPKGGQYEVILPDGTKVWLNAASTLKYPALFAVNERKVELAGEAYFEVAKISIKSQVSGIKRTRRMPFVVKTANQEVEVLGTHFNINSYADEPATKTTLLEGSVRVSDNVVLKPGQQAINNNQSGANNVINVVPIDPETEVAWKNGRFMFNDESIESIMRKIARWYDVKVEYKGKITPKQVFGGTINKFGNVSKVLEMLELTKAVHFKIEGRKITVMP